ncbi:hypothetical protein ACEQ8H_002532 [Pleosporales sp. CAS-2024a]
MNVTLKYLDPSLVVGPQTRAKKYRIAHSRDISPWFKGSHQSHVDNVPQQHRVHRAGNWLPSDHRVHKDWLDSVIDKAKASPKKLHAVMQEFKEFIQGDTRIYLVCSMFEEIPKKEALQPKIQSATGRSVTTSSYKFEELFKCDPVPKSNWGYRTSSGTTSSRGLVYEDKASGLPRQKMTASFANACESMPYKVARNVQSPRSRFWVKG